MAQEPILIRGGLTGRVYVVTRYKTVDGQPTEALKKYDVTDQFDALVDHDDCNAALNDFAATELHLRAQLSDSPASCAVVDQVLGCTCGGIMPRHMPWCTPDDGPCNHDLHMPHPLGHPGMFGREPGSGEGIGDGGQYEECRLACQMVCGQPLSVSDGCLTHGLPDRDICETWMTSCSECGETIDVNGPRDSKYVCSHGEGCNPFDADDPVRTDGS